MVQAEASGKTCFGIGEAQPIDAERAGKGEYDILKAGKGEYDILKVLQFRNCHTPVGHFVPAPLA